MVGPNDTLTEHQHNWWGTQRCRRCNPTGLEHERPHNMRPHCPDCDGSGWTKWAALATEPWTEIIPNLWVGGHDYTDVSRLPGRSILTVSPENLFDVVVSMYYRAGFEPNQGEHVLARFDDSELTHSMKRKAVSTARIVADRHEKGLKVLARCQAGLNRSSLVAGIAMVALGYHGEDAVQLIRARRSPWALCNDDYASYIIKGAAEDLRKGLE